MVNLTTVPPNTTEVAKHHVEEKQSAILFFIFCCCAVGGKTYQVLTCQAFFNFRGPLVYLINLWSIYIYMVIGKDSGKEGGVHCLYKCDRTCGL